MTMFAKSWEPSGGGPSGPSGVADPVLQAFARAPMGPADPPEVRAAILEGEELGRFVPGAEVSDEVEQRRRAWQAPGK